jgi:hypothetical protein
VDDCTVHACTETINSSPNFWQPNDQIRGPSSLTDVVRFWPVCYLSTSRLHYRSCLQVPSAIRDWNQLHFTFSTRVHSPSSGRVLLWQCSHLGVSEHLPRLAVHASRFGQKMCTAVVAPEPHMSCSAGVGSCVPQATRHRPLQLLMCICTLLLAVVHALRGIPEVAKFRQLLMLQPHVSRGARVGPPQPPNPSCAYVCTCRAGALGARYHCRTCTAADARATCEPLTSPKIVNSFGTDST